MGEPEPADHALGRSRGGWTTKLHLATEQGQKPLTLLVTAGQRGDSPQVEAVLARVRVARVGGGRARSRPDRVLAGKAYSSRANRAYLRRREIACTFGSGPASPQSWGGLVVGHPRSTRSSLRSNRAHRRDQRVATPLKQGPDGSLLLWGTGGAVRASPVPGARPWRSRRCPRRTRLPR
ncbi:transposase IS4 family protein [Amycolatopsis vancoresmycina DSM 44592]|uniref:Transposase IS4 family protein n=1 Tax=Amycolatopsis vancoresmycina DSM 44592 TaxID=1292037 RepID=R1HUE4_9PSEU|nr:transposase IS4 family protein [Amycolatopsis vancoresmycina DSM 44592]